MLNDEERAVLLAARRYGEAYRKAERARKTWHAIKKTGDGRKVAAHEDYVRLNCAATNAHERLLEVARAV